MLANRKERVFSFYVNDIFSKNDYEYKKKKCKAAFTLIHILMVYIWIYILIYTCNI